ncbi:fidgetin-like protein 2 [Megalops cyprinoides]|uniref:fidgetin-like protein 2 n=1 Tax=Megalops cyprinoides TaxID=118141 RepID=UPI001865027C|nr:fidgetin-like protein 2 [Megalops cyprinoides]
MLSPVVPYSLLKMHWTPEHAQSVRQWPEQHLDVSSTTSSPAHKPDLYAGRNRSYSYAWANEDISALTASSLLKRYAEKYSSTLDSPYDRPTVGTYPEPAAFSALNGQKSELDPWPLSHCTEGAYPLVPPSGHEGLAGAKVVGTAAGVLGTGGVSVVNNSLSDPGYSAGNSCSAPPSHDYPPAYNGTYLSSGYCPQPSSALPPSSLHPLQPATTLVPSYTPPGPVYNYPPSNYSHQPSLAPSYTHPSAPYLPSGLAAPTPLPSRPTVVGGSYGYQNQNLGGTERGGSLKRKAFEMTGEEEEGDSSRYRKYGYDHSKVGMGSPYGMGNKEECHSNGFGTGRAGSQAFKRSKPPSQSGLGRDELGKYSGLKPLVSPPYGGASEYSPPARMTGENGGGEHSYPQHHLGPKLPAPCAQSGELLKSADPRLLELVTGELQDRNPAPLWGELLGQTQVKSALEEDLLWPMLRPGPARHPPRTILLFGPQGGGKTSLSRCVASQLGATFFRLSSTALTSKWKAEAEKILHTLFLVAGARAPCVVLISQLEALQEEGLRQQLWSYLETAQGGVAGPVVVVCTTRRPDLLEEAAHRCFTKRYYVGLPDAGARRQALLQALAPHGCCLSECEMGAVLQRTEGFSVPELLQLCQQASASASASSPAPMHGLPNPTTPPTFKDFENAFCKVRPHATAKELDTCMEWSKVHSQ